MMQSKHGRKLKKTGSKKNKGLRKTRRMRRKGGNGNIDTDVSNVKKRTYEKFAINVSLTIFSRIILNFMEIYPFYNRSGQWVLGPYFSDYIENNNLDYTPISNFIKDFNQVLNETVNTNIEYINPDYFKMKEQVNFLIDLYKEKYGDYESAIDYYIDCLNATKMIDSRIYDLILNKDIRYRDDNIFDIPGDSYEDGNEKFQYYILI
jgi:hypothetical protein